MTKRRAFEVGDTVIYSGRRAKIIGVAKLNDRMPDMSRFVIRFDEFKFVPTETVPGYLLSRPGAIRRAP